MYHIKKDKRAETSAELICGALLQLIEEKPFHEITVTDIQAVSTVSRSTFYRNFDSPEDVLMLLCDRGFSTAMESAAEKHEELRVAVFRYWFAHSSILETLVAIHRTDILAESFRRNETIGAFLRATSPDAQQSDYFAEIVCGVIIGILIAWVKHGKTETEQEAMEQVQQAFMQILCLGLLGDPGRMDPAER